MNPSESENFVDTRCRMKWKGMTIVTIIMYYVGCCRVFLYVRRKNLQFNWLFDWNPVYNLNSYRCYVL